MAVICFAFIGSCRKQDPIYEIYERSTVSDLMEKGRAYLREEKVDSALLYYSLSANKYDENLPDSTKNIIAEAYAKQGYIYLFYKNDYISSLSSLLNALDILEKTGDRSLYPYIYLHIGNIYLDYQDDNKTLDYHKKAFRYSVEEKDWQTMMVVFTSLLSYAITEDVQDLIKDEIALFDSIEDVPDSPDFRALSLQLEAYRAISNSDYDRGIELLKEARNTGSLGLIQDRYASICDIQIADVLRNQGKLKEAIEYVKLNLCGDSTALDIKKSSSGILGDLYMCTDQADSAMKYMNLNRIYGDSLFRSQQFSMLGDVGTTHEVKKLDTKIQSIEAERNRAQLLLWFSVAILVIVILFGIIVFMQNRKLVQRNMDLFNHHAQALERERQERNIREMLEKQIEELNALKNKNENVESSSSPVEAAQADLEPRKYKNSHLSDAMQSGLLTKIDSVMNDENEIVSNDFSLDRLASLVASNTSYVSQIINEVYDKNFHTLLGEARIKLACNRLCDKKYEHLTIEGIAQELGFKSRTNFISVFKKVTGLTPSEYRKISRKSGKPAV